MDDDFDLYGDADIYATTEVKEDEPGKVQVNEEDARMNNVDGNASGTGSKRQRDDASGVDAKQESSLPAPAAAQPSASGYNGSSGSYAPVSSSSYGPDQGRPMEDVAAPGDPATARVALAGRPKVTDPNVQNAVYVGELDWWVSDEEIRKIANEVGIPLRLSDVTFSEHKVNGKSKGVAFVELVDEDEARRFKQWFENNDVNYKRATVSLTTSANGNPFKTLPKDPPPREGRPQRGGGRGGMAMGAREGGGRREGGGGMGGSMGGGMGGQSALPMAGAPIRMGGGSGPPPGMPMMNPMMMGMMGGANGRPPFGGNFMGGGNGGRGGGGYGRGQGRGGGAGHFNPNFFGGGRGGGGGGGGDDRERKRYRSDENY